jgi:YVTN family beta-propeller protein
VPLLATIDPKIASDMATSLLNDAAQMGALPKWPVANGEAGVMNGDAADPILADSYAFGARGFDTAAALADMVAGANGTSQVGQGWYVERPNAAAYIARGYVPNVASDSISPVPNGASETLEYALDDFAISRLAGNLHQSGTAGTFTHRSQNWANLFDTADGGYIEPRDASGAFPSGPPVPTSTGFGQDGFQEGNAAQYTWMVPQNLAGLIQGLGGDQAANSRLDDYFSQLNAGPNLPYHWQGNEPAFDTPWVYDSTGEPWRTQQVVGQIMSQLYALTPGGEPGNDDLGAMSSWYVWASLGLYPQTPGVPMLVLGTPQFPQAVIHGAYGTLTVSTHGTGGYVNHLAVDGRTSQHTWIDPSRVHTLDFDLTGSPDKTWGTAAADAPPSFGAGPVTFPASTAAALTASPGQVRLSPGSSASVSVTADNTAGTGPAAVTWNATAPSGLSVTPAGGTLGAPAGGTASASVTVTAAAGLATGYYQVTLAAHAANGAVIPPVTLLVTVAAAGQSIPTAYVSNYSDNTVTPVDTRTGTAGPPIAVGSGPDGMTVAGGDLFVANNNSNDVTVLDTSTNAVIKTIPVGSVAADVAATPDGKTVWVTNFGDGTVQPIDVATLTTGTPVPVGSQPERLAVSPDGSQLWVANQGSGTVSDISLATGAVAHTITVGAAPFGVAVTPDSGHVYVTNGGSSSVSVIDTSSAGVTGTVATGADPQYVRIAPDGSVAYVADFGAGGVTPIALPGNAAGTFIPTGSGAYAVGFDPSGTTAWVVNTNANTVTPVTVATGTPGTSVTVGNVPDGVTVTG